MVSVCIIGAGCSIKHTKIGDKIDSHNVVIRVNGHEVDGHEEDVGSKCTILCTFPCKQQLQTCLQTPIFIGIHELWLFKPDHRIITKTIPGDIAHNLYLGDVLSKFNAKSLIIFGSPPWSLFPGPQQDRQKGETHRLVEYYKQQPHLSNTVLERPSTGFMAIVMAIYRWGNVSIAGFGKRESVRLGYYDKDLTLAAIGARNDTTAHDYEAERLLLNELEEKKLVERLDDPYI